LGSDEGQKDKQAKGIVPETAQRWQDTSYSKFKESPGNNAFSLKGKTLLLCQLLISIVEK
jgi:hypothetical protein